MCRLSGECFVCKEYCDDIKYVLILWGGAYIICHDECLKTFIKQEKEEA